MDFHTYVINLEHAKERWRHMCGQLEPLGVSFTRIEGVYGDRLSDPVDGYDGRRYRLLTGKATNKREIGCYFSHLVAMRAFLASERPYALILEDDVTLPVSLPALLEEAAAHAADWDMLRLTSSRRGEFLTFAALSHGFALGYNLKVLKNTGAYVVNRHAARCCVERLLPMRLPYDVALDREWDLGFKTACVTPFPVLLAEALPGQIPKAKRIPLYRATTFHLFHILTHFQRIAYRRRCSRALRGRRGTP